MAWVARTINSSIGKKAVMAVSGLLLGLFVLVHMLGNSTALAGRDAFLAYAAALHAHDRLLLVFELLLLVFFLVHVTLALLLTLANRAARPVPYAVTGRAGGGAGIGPGSRTMLYSGLFLLVFLVVHLVQFKFGGRELPVADLLRQVLAQPLFTIFYLAAVLALTLHLSHGFWSLWQSLGVEHPKYNPLLQRGAVALAVLTGLLFSLVPLAVLFFPDFLR